MHVLSRCSLAIAIVLSLVCDMPALLEHHRFLISYLTLDQKGSGTRETLDRFQRTATFLSRSFTGTNFVLALFSFNLVTVCRTTRAMTLDSGSHI
jgi:hypothetical protein